MADPKPTVLCELDDCEFKEWRTGVVWHEKADGDIYSESLSNMLDYYPELFHALANRTLPTALADHINNDLRCVISVPADKEVTRATFIRFTNRARHDLAHYGVVIKSYKNRTAYEWEADDLELALVGHFDFELLKEYKPKRQESHEEYTKRKLKGTRGNIGTVTAGDEFVIIGSSKFGKAYDFLVARNIYQEEKIKHLTAQLAVSAHKNATSLVNVMDTILKDMSFEAAKYLDDKYKVRLRRPHCSFSDKLYQLLKKSHRFLQFEKRGRYYKSKALTMQQAAKIFHPSHIVINFKTDPPHDMYMKDITLLYNQTSHRLYLRFNVRKRVSTKDNHSNHV